MSILSGLRGMEGFVDNFKWKYEAVRRSPEFKKDFKHFLVLLDQAGFEYDEIKKSAPDFEDDDYDQKRIEWYRRTDQYFGTDAHEFQSKCCYKYGLPKITCFLPHPDLPFDEVKNRLLGHLSALETCQHSVICATKTLPFITSEATLENRERLMILIDFSRINKIGDLKKVVWEMINSGFKDYLKENEKNPRVNDKDYDFIFKVGEMRSGGIRPAAVARELLPEEFDKTPDSAIDKINYCYDSYNNLISGGYNDMVFP